MLMTHTFQQKRSPLPIYTTNNQQAIAQSAIEVYFELKLILDVFKNILQLRSEMRNTLCEHRKATVALLRILTTFLCTFHHIWAEFSEATRRRSFCSVSML